MNKKQGKSQLRSRLSQRLRFKFRSTKVKVHKKVNKHKRVRLRSGRATRMEAREPFSRPAAKRCIFDTIQNPKKTNQPPFPFWFLSLEKILPFSKPKSSPLSPLTKPKKSPSPSIYHLRQPPSPDSGGWKIHTSPKYTWTRQKIQMKPKFRWHLNTFKFLIQNYFDLFNPYLNSKSPKNSSISTDLKKTFQNFRLSNPYKMNLESPNPKPSLTFSYFLLNQHRR